MRLEYISNHTKYGLTKQEASEKIQFALGDIRDFQTVLNLVQNVNIIFNVAAKKQVPSCEFYPYEAVKTNIIGTQNLVDAIQTSPSVETVIGISTDKAASPSNVMGMTKAIQERILLAAAFNHQKIRFVQVRCGNVLGSRGSVIPLFHQQISNGGPVTLTDSRMTRFMFSINDAVDLIFTAYQHGHTGEIFVPEAPSLSMLNVAKALIDNREIEIKEVGVRPGEKLHEILITDEEKPRTKYFTDEQNKKYFVIASDFTKLSCNQSFKFNDDHGYSSENGIISLEETKNILEKNNLCKLGELAIEY